ncbi:hypothetical protein CBR_g12769 [Chara braunii]|uniref:RRM domain-containing protein n=1 Tax=Chara braunii TaxID=69332 RepID=A0A388KSS0_CHABU|nr:hypothetical protein CBR_g12769 [Chara braunii]|eukprot:GBG73052.1 hypothetical protein CBR_g12769 [Chara braunii]
MSRSSRTIYVGNLPGDIKEREIEDLFYKYGRIIDIDLKLPPRPPGYAFIEFEDARDAEDAIRGRDGYNFDGNRLRVELAHGGRASASVDRYSSYSGSSGRLGGLSRRSDYRVMVTGLPSSASWQDLKDHMRRAGDVCFAQVFRDGNGTVGIVDYNSYEDMKHAVRKLDDSEFRNPFAKSYIRVREDRGSYYSSRSRSRSPSRDRDRSHSCSRSRSPVRSHSHSRSRSRSRSRPVRRSSKRYDSRSRSGSRSRSPSASRSASLSRSKSPKSHSRSPRRSASPAKARSTSRSRSASRGRSLSRSASRSPSRSKSRSHSRPKLQSLSPTNGSPSRSFSRSRSRSRGRSPMSNGHDE